MHSLTVDQKIDIVVSRNCQNPETYRSLEKRIGIDHSTLHAMTPRLTDEIKESLIFRDSFFTKKKLVQTILTLSLVGQMSSRAIAQSILLLFGKKISHDTVLSILNHGGVIAKELNEKYITFENSKVVLLDEIFLSRQPILGFVDQHSGAIHFNTAPDKSAHSWEVELDSMIVRGLNPVSVIGDGGSGQNAALQEKMPLALFSLDLFHILDKLQRAEKVLENNAYHLIKRVYEYKGNKLTSQKSKYQKLYTKMERAVILYDSFAESKKKCIPVHISFREVLAITNVQIY